MPHKDFVITTATIADAPAITQISVTTFCDTFATDNSKEDMDMYIAEQMNEAKIAAELRDSHNTFFLAYHYAALIGYAKIRGTAIPTELADSKPLEIERLYVHRDYHNKKVGAALMQHCLAYAQANHYNMIWLGVWEHNDRAISFYEKWGFKPFGSHGFQLGNDTQTDLLMKKAL